MPTSMPATCGSSAPPRRERRIIAIDDQGENQIIVSPGANSGLTAGDVEAGLAAMQAGDVLILQLEIPTALVRQAARTAKSRGAFVILNAAPAPGQLDGLLDDVDLLVVNEQEIQVLAGLAGIPGSHRELVRTLPPVLGPDIVCTAGAEGSFTASTAILCTCRLRKWPPRTPPEPATRSWVTSPHPWPAALASCLPQ